MTAGVAVREYVAAVVVDAGFGEGRCREWRLDGARLELNSILEAASVEGCLGLEEPHRVPLPREPEPVSHEHRGRPPHLGHEEGPSIEAPDCNELANVLLRDLGPHRQDAFGNCAGLEQDAQAQAHDGRTHCPARSGWLRDAQTAWSALHLMIPAGAAMTMTATRQVLNPRTQPPAVA